MAQPSTSAKAETTVAWASIKAKTARPDTSAKAVSWPGTSVTTEVTTGKSTAAEATKAWPSTSATAVAAMVVKVSSTTVKWMVEKLVWYMWS